MVDVSVKSSALISSLASDPDLGDLVDLFVCELPDRVRALQTAWERADRDGVGRFAHQLKGAAGSYGFGQLTPALKQLELLAREHGSEEEIELALQEVTQLCARVRSEEHR